MRARLLGAQDEHLGVGRLAARHLLGLQPERVLLAAAERRHRLDRDHEHLEHALAAGEAVDARGLAVGAELAAVRVVGEEEVAAELDLLHLLGRGRELERRSLAPRHVALPALQRERLPRPLAEHEVGLPADRQLVAQPLALERLEDQRLPPLGHVDLEQQQVVAVDDHRLDPREVELLLHRRLEVEQVERALPEADVHPLAVLADHAEELDLLLQHVLDPLEDEAGGRHRAAGRRSKISPRALP